MGSVAKIGWGCKKPGPGFSLSGNPEQTCHESDLPQNILSPNSFNLPFPDHIHRLMALDCPMRRLDAGKPESGIDSTFYDSVVLLEDIIEVFSLPELIGRHVFSLLF